MGDEQLGQDDIERLLNGGGGAAEQPPEEPQAEADLPSESIDQAEIEALMAGVSGQPPADPTVPELPLSQDEIEALTSGAQGKGADVEPSMTSEPASDGDDVSLGQDDIEALLAGNAPPAPAPKVETPPPQPEPVAAAPTPPPAPAPEPAATAAPPTPQPAAPQPAPSQFQAGEGSSPPLRSVGSDVNVLLEQAQRALSSIDQPATMNADVKPFHLADLSGSKPSNEKTSLDLLRDVELELKIELGRTKMQLEEMMKLKSGSVVALDKLAGDPVDVYVNGRMVAKGEVLVFNDNFCVRVAELITGDDL